MGPSCRLGSAMAKNNANLMRNRSIQVTKVLRLATMKRIVTLPLLLVAGCATTLNGEIGQCRPDVAVPPSSSSMDSRLECDIRVEERAKSEDYTRKTQ